MRVEVYKWGNSAAVRIPALALRDSGVQVGQSLELRVEGGRLVLEPAAESLDALLAKVTLQNRHGLNLEAPSAVAET
jgi:antitoxin MazE